MRSKGVISLLAPAALGRFRRAGTYRSCHAQRDQSQSVIACEGEFGIHIIKTIMDKVEFITAALRAWTQAARIPYVCRLFCDAFRHYAAGGRRLVCSSGNIGGERRHNRMAGIVLNRTLHQHPAGYENFIRRIYSSSSSS